jgi:hypothetical protein
LFASLLWWAEPGRHSTQPRPRILESHLGIAAARTTGVTAFDISFVEEDVFLDVLRISRLHPGAHIAACCGVRLSRFSILPLIRQDREELEAILRDRDLHEAISYMVMRISTERIPKPLL